jgi:hypothetical protein
MGKKTKIAWLLVIVLALLSPAITGCDQATTYPPPTIAVEEFDSAASTSVMVTFYNTFRKDNGHGPPYVQLNNADEVRAYIQEVEFLLSRLEETERRMNIHEPEPVEQVEVAE